MNKQSKAWVRDPDAKRVAILQAALEVFFEQGFHGAQIPKIAAKAKVSAGLIYRFFPSKQDLVNVLYRLHKGDLRSRLLTSIAAEAQPEMQFRRLVATMTAFAGERPVAFLFLETHFHKPYLDDESRALEATTNDEIERWVVRAQALGAVKAGQALPIAAAVLGAIVYLVRGVCSHRFSGDDAMLREYTDMLWRMVRA